MRFVTIVQITEIIIVKRLAKTVPEQTISEQRKKKRRSKKKRDLNHSHTTQYNPLCKKSLIHSSDIQTQLLSAEYHCPLNELTILFITKAKNNKY